MEVFKERESQFHERLAGTVSHREENVDTVGKTRSEAAPLQEDAQREKNEKA